MKKLTTGLFLFSALVFSGLTANAQTTYEEIQEKSQSMIQELNQTIELTAEQRLEIGTINTAILKEQASIRQQMQMLQAREKELETEKISKIREVLTPEQVKVLDEQLRAREEAKRKK